MKFFKPEDFGELFNITPHTDGESEHAELAKKIFLQGFADIANKKLKREGIPIYSSDFEDENNSWWRDKSLLMRTTHKSIMLPPWEIEKDCE